MWTTFEDGEQQTRSFMTSHGRATRVTTQQFIDLYLPRVPLEQEPQRVLASLKRRIKFWNRLVTKNDRLWGYGKKNPSQYQEDRAYTQLRVCYEKLALAAASRNNALRFLEHSNDSAQSVAGRDAFPDVGLVLLSEESGLDRAPWSSTAVSGVLRPRANEGASRIVGSPFLHSRARIIAHSPR